MLATVGLTINRLALGVWVGVVGTLFLAGLAVLDALPGGKVYTAVDDSTMRVSAGEIVSELFVTYYGIALVLGALAAAGAWLSRASGYWRRWQFGAHLVGLSVMIAGVLVDALWVYGKVHPLAEQIPDTGLTSESPIYASFWMWHGISMTLSCVVLGVGVITTALACLPIASREGGVAGWS